jgi:hypothetical protein
VVKLVSSRVEKSLPYRIPLFGSTEGKQTEGSVSDTIVILFFDKSLLGDAPGGQVVQVMLAKFDFSGGPEEFTNGQSSMTGFVDASLFAGCGSDGSVFVNVLQVVAQQRTCEI